MAEKQGTDNKQSEEGTNYRGLHHHLIVMYEAVTQAAPNLRERRERVGFPVLHSPKHILPYRGREGSNLCMPEPSMVLQLLRVDAALEQ